MFKPPLMINNSDKKVIDSTYEQAIIFTKSHYENFPVISFFISPELRKHIAIVYQFARQADDIADEGDKNPNFRIEELSKYQKSFENCLEKKFDNPFWQTLANTILTYNLSPDNFIKLIAAFQQDIIKNRYYDFQSVLNYCEKSANPIGRIILELHQVKNYKSMVYSDKICTALQLTNFYQDVKIDLEKNRIYLPQDELQKFNINSELKITGENDNFIPFMKFQIERTRTLFKDGYQLLEYLPVKLKYHIKLTIKGGEAILNKIVKNNYKVLENRPKLSKQNYFGILIKTIF